MMVLDVQALLLAHSGPWWLWPHCWLCQALLMLHVSTGYCLWLVQMGLILTWLGAWVADVAACMNLLHPFRYIVNGQCRGQWTLIITGREATPCGCDEMLTRTVVWSYLILMHEWILSKLWSEAACILYIRFWESIRPRVLLLIRHVHLTMGLHKVELYRRQSYVASFNAVLHWLVLCTPHVKISSHPSKVGGSL